MQFLVARVGLSGSGIGYGELRARAGGNVGHTGAREGRPSRAGAETLAEPVHVQRIFPLVLLHASKRVEQSRHPVQLLARGKVQLERRESGLTQQRHRSRMWTTISRAAAGTSADRISTPIRLRVRAPSRRRTRTGCRASRSRRRTRTRTIRCRASRSARSPKHISHIRTTA